MELTFHGVRGSTPCHGDEIARYGGNTSCVSLDVPGHDPILFDLGTGLRYFGLTQPVDEPFRGTCLLSHLHWDHIQGLPFFKPFLRPGSNVTLYAPEQPGDITVADVFADTIKPPLFPIHFSMFPGMVDIHEVGDDEFTIGNDVRVMTRLIPHVGHTLGYRVEWQGRSLVYMSDHQMPTDGSHSAWPGAFDLCSGADLLIHDAQYTPEEFATKRDWGHCTPEYAVWLAGKAGVKRLALFHHDPAHDDDELDDILAPVIDCAAKLGVDAFAARERMTVSILDAVAAVGVVASILLGLVFLVSGGSKVAAGRAWPEQARGLGAPVFAVPVLPWFEIVLGAVLVMQLVPVLAAAIAVAVLIAFTALIVRRLAEGQHPPCACFGSWSAKPLGRAHVIRNAGFIGLGIIALLA